jgi:hypothetical protein
MIARSRSAGAPTSEVIGMLRNPSLLFCLGLIALASASLAGVCGDPEAVGTPTADVTAVASVQPPATETMFATETPVAGTPVPTTATVAAAPTRFPTLAPLPTAASNDEPMGIGGTVWADGRPATGDVVALVNGQECGRAKSGRTDSGDPIASTVIVVASEAMLPGCGTPGAPVTVLVNGRQIRQSILWQAGYAPTSELVVGAPFVQYFGELHGSALPDSFEIVPVINGIDCGVDLSPARQGVDAVWFRAVVDSSGLTPGCGAEGSSIEFIVRSPDRPDTEVGTTSWSDATVATGVQIDLSYEDLGPTPPSKTP